MWRAEGQSPEEQPGGVTTLTDAQKTEQKKQEAEGPKEIDTWRSLLSPVKPGLGSTGLTGFNAESLPPEGQTACLTA